jgi:hypothetical protein
MNHRHAEGYMSDYYKWDKDVQQRAPLVYLYLHEFHSMWGYD